MRPVYRILILFLIFNLVGCDAFVRKFTRKKKKVDMQEELVLEPQEYKGPQIPKEDLYRQYLFYWKSWQDELVLALIENTSHKKQVDCANEALKNLANMRKMLKEDKQKLLDAQIKKMIGLKDDITADIYGKDNNYNRRVAERIKISILQKFSADDIKDGLK